MLYIPNPYFQYCSECLQLLPATPQYFHHWDNDKIRISNLCRSCHLRREIAQHFKDNPHIVLAFKRFRQEAEGKRQALEQPWTAKTKRERRRAKQNAKNNIPDGFKLCNQCSQILPATAEYFHRDKSKTDGFHGICAQCRCENGKKWREEHPEESAAYHRKLYYENHEKRKAVQREYENSHRAERAAYERAFYAEHPELKKAKDHRRKARKNALPNTFTGDDWQRCLDYWGNRCAACGREPGEGFVLSPDHWIPLSAKRPDNPGTVATNIVPLCNAVNGGRGGCNNSKHTSDPFKWLARRFGEEQATEIVQRVEAYFAAVRANAHETAEASNIEE
jgi:hypothetical protein